MTLVLGALLLIFLWNIDPRSVGLYTRSNLLYVRSGKMLRKNATKLEIENERRYLLNEKKGLFQELNSLSVQLQASIWNSLDFNQKIVKREQEIRESPEFLEEKRVSYQKELVKNELKPLRDEKAENSALREVLSLKLSELKLRIEINREELKLLS